MAKKISPERQTLLDEFADIRDVKIDRTLPVEERMISYVQQIKNPCCFYINYPIISLKILLQILSGGLS